MWQNIIFIYQIKLDAKAIVKFVTHKNSKASNLKNKDIAGKGKSLFNSYLQDDALNDALNDALENKLKLITTDCKNSKQTK